MQQRQAACFLLLWQLTKTTLFANLDAALQGTRPNGGFMDYLLRNNCWPGALGPDVAFSHALDVSAPGPWFTCVSRQFICVLRNAVST